MKNHIRLGASFVTKLLSPPIDIIQNLLGLVILNRKYSSKLKECKTFDSREKLWNFSANYLDANNKSISFLEFGVHTGYSINYFSKLIKNRNSNLYGFDSFEGLPESWRNFINIYPAEHFDVGGKIPSTNDPRIAFIKGWFNETFPRFLKLNEEKLSKSEHILIHLDADLYSSTLYVLSSIAQISNDFYCIFDELPGEESRALYDFTTSFGFKIDFLGFSGPSHIFPMQVFARIYK